MRRPLWSIVDRSPTVPEMCVVTPDAHRIVYLVDINAMCSFLTLFRRSKWEYLRRATVV